MGENEIMVKGHKVCNMVLPQDLASLKALVQSYKLTNVIFMEAVHRRGCPVMCFVHGMVEVKCKDVGSPLQQW